MGINSLPGKLIAIALISSLFITCSCISITPRSELSEETGKKPLIHSFVANPDSITQDETATLSWEVEGATSVNIDKDIGEVALLSSRKVTPQETTVYTLTATNNSGFTTATAQVMVDTQAMDSSQQPSTATGRPVIDLFATSPDTIIDGEATNLIWQVSNADKVTLSAQGKTGIINTSGTAIIAPSSSTVYALNATNKFGTSIAKTQVIVIPGSQEGLPDILFFTAFPQPARTGNAAYLQWEVANAETVIIEPGIGPVAPRGLIKINPVSTTVYTLTAANSMVGQTEEPQTLYGNFSVETEVFFTGGEKRVEFGVVVEP